MLGIALLSLEMPRTPSGPSTVTSLPLPLALGNADMPLDMLTLDGPHSRLVAYHAMLRWLINTAWMTDSWRPELSCCTRTGC